MARSMPARIHEPEKGFGERQTLRSGQSLAASVHQFQRVGLEHLHRLNVDVAVGDQRDLRRLS